MSVAPHAGIIDFGTFTPPTLTLDGIQGEVPQPLIGQENYVLTGNGWSSLADIGGLSYQGTWDASTNTPTLVSSVGTQGFYYVVSVAGTTNLNGITSWAVGDWAVFNGSTWQKIQASSTFGTMAYQNADSVDITGGTITGLTALGSDYLQLNTSATPTIALGKLRWNADTATASFGIIDGTTEVNIGEQMYAYVTNAESVTITAGQAVYLYQATGNRASVKLAYNTGDATSAKTLGLVTADIGANQTGFVTTQGVLSKVNTGAFTEGATLYLGATPGSLTSTKPQAPNHLVYIGVVERANAGNGQIYVRPQNGYELDEIHDVQITPPVTTGQTIVYDASSALWKNSNANVMIGGSINNTPIGATTPSTGAFTTLTTSSTATIADTSTVGQFGVKLAAGFAPGGVWDSKVALFGNVNLATGAGSGALGISFDTSAGASLISIAPNSSWYNIQYLGNVHRFFGLGTEQFRISPTASSVNYFNMSGAATGGIPNLSVQGSDASIAMILQSKGTSPLILQNGSAQRILRVDGTGAGTNYLNVVSSATTQAPILSVASASSDTNVSMAFQPKGTGAIDLAAGSGGINISNGGTVTGITRSGTGTGYSSAPTVTIAPPTTAGGVQATAQASGYGSTAGVIVSGGTGYTLNDVITVSAAGAGGTYTVTGVSAGVVTAVTTTGNGGTYTSIPTNPVATTGGTGTGLTLNLSNFYIVNFAVLTAGSGYVEQPAVTVTGGGGSGASAYVTIGSPTIIRSLGGVGNSAQSMSFHTSSGETLRLATGTTQATGGTAVANFFQMAPGASGNGPALSAIGTDTNVWALISSKGTGSVALQTNSGVAQTVITNTASAVNYLQLTGAVTLGSPSISAQGSDSSIQLLYKTKGNWNHIFTDGSTANAFVIDVTGANTGVATNYLSVTRGPTTQVPLLKSLGTDTNVSLGFQPKGTGAIDLAAGSSGVNISNGGTVTGITRTALGTSYTSPPTVNISAPTTTGGVQATATVPLQQISPFTIVSGGTGYTVGDTLTVSGGTWTTVPTMTVATVSAGVITSITQVNYGVGSVIPSNPISVTGGTGTGATFSTTAWGISAVFTITNAGSGYIEQPTITFSGGGGGSGAAAIASVGSGTSIKSLNGVMSFYTPSGESVRINNASFPTLTDYVELRGGSSVAGAYATVGGSTTNANFYLSSKGTGSVTTYTNNFASTQFSVAHTASAVNYLQATGSVTGGLTILSSTGSDASVGMELRTKGTPSGPGFRITNNNGANTCFSVQTSVGTPANYIQLQPSATATSPQVTAQGSDTNISLALQPKGTGAIDLVAGTSGINISNGGTVTALTRTSTGAGYTSFPSIAISVPTTTGGVQATASVLQMFAGNPTTVAGGGTGYTLNDTLTLVGGTSSGAATYTVTGVTAGVITSVTALNYGTYTALPTNPVSVTGGTGTGATLNVTYGIQNVFNISNAGSGYIEQPTVTFSGGGGTSQATAFASVGTVTTIKGIGSALERSIAFQGPSGLNILELDGTGVNTTAETIRIQPTQYSRTNIVAVGGTNSQMWLSASGTGYVNFCTRGTSLVTQFRVADTASAVNYFTATGSATGTAVQLLAAGSDTNIPIALQPKGTGALQSKINDGTAANGNARGSYAVDWQTSRNAATQVASGYSSVITGGEANISNSYISTVAGGTGNQATGSYSFVGGGLGSIAQGPYSKVGGGYLNSGLGYLNVIGGGDHNSGTANAAVTTQATTAVTSGSTSVTLSASNASIKIGQFITGTGIVGYPNNTYVANISGTTLTLSQAANASGTPTLSFFTPHGVVVGGGNNQATGAYSFIGGGGDAGTASNRNVASGDWSFVGGGKTNTASGYASVVVGGGSDTSATALGSTASGVASTVIGGLANLASGTGSTTLGGYQNQANATVSTTIGGRYGDTRAIAGNTVFSACNTPIAGGLGYNQAAILILARQTTDATPVTLASSSVAATAGNQVTLPNNSAYYFRGEIVAGVTGGGNTKGWYIEGVIKRGANASTTALVGSPTITSNYADAGASTWAVAVTADTTNGSLAITVTGQAATTIRWVAQVRTTEMTY